ncbi:MAG TPA: hypothetical protein DCY61_05780 [Dehalococcoidia bacterium]|nr:hypothetical protein [Dehalococcoidia bacterium]
MTESKELQKVEPGQVVEVGGLTELERQVVYHKLVEDSYMMDIERQEGLELGHSVRARVKRDKETGEKTILSVGRPDDLKEFDDVLAEGGYTHDMAGITPRSIERAREKFSYLYGVAKQLGLPPPATGSEVERVIELAESAPFAKLAAAAAEVNKERRTENGE